MKIAILGGSGKLGRGFSLRLPAHEVAIGSRDPSKGMPYGDAAAWCEVAIVAVPYSAHEAVLAALQIELRGKIVVDAAVPLHPLDPTLIQTSSGMSAAEEAALALPESHVFAAFQTVSHLQLMKPDAVADVLVAGGATGREAVFDLIRSMNLRPILAGPLHAAGLIERVTALLISINKSNRVRESSIRIEGVF